MSRFVSGVYDTRESAERGIDALTKAGFPRDEISILVSGDHRERHFREHESTEPRAAGDRSASGAAVGATLGAVAGGLAAVASLAVPGGIFVAGPIAAAIGGGFAGAAGGTLLGALVGAGISEHEAKYYAGELNRGAILVSAAAGDATRAALARMTLNRTGARTIATQDGEYQGAHTS